MASGPLSSPPHYLLSSPDQRSVTTRILVVGKLTLPEELAFGKLLMESEFQNNSFTPTVLSIGHAWHHYLRLVGDFVHSRLNDDDDEYLSSSSSNTLL